jgi:oxygen-independent coproporphyrinogen-3 oxidase
VSGLYLHIPFCEHKCIYCDFYSIESRAPMDAFRDALRAEIEMSSLYSSAEKFDTIFFGGGTPSLLEPAAIAEILILLRSTFDVATDAEVTLETNPGTVDRAKLAAFRRAGVNRLSFGVQTFHEDELRFLTRIHSAAEAEDAVRFAQEEGFDNVNVDLIFALPHQTMERWQENVRRAIGLGIQHVSAYSLIVEQGTPLARMVRAKQLSTVPLETEAAMYEWTMEYFRSMGFVHYEVSNYALPGFESRHNKGYWNHSNYLGFGPSAHSFWNRSRWWNVSNVTSYCDKIAARHAPVIGEETLSDRQLLDEAIMLGLRSDGIELDRLHTAFGIDLIDQHESFVTALCGDGLASIEHNRLRLTDKGYLLCDSICALLIEQAAAA